MKIMCEEGFYRGLEKNENEIGRKIVQKKTKKMKIAMLGHKRIPSREGGVEIVVEELSERMVEQGHRVICYNRKGHHVGGDKYDTKKLKNYKGMEIKTVLTIEKKGLAAVSSSFFATIKAIFGKFDVIHYHAEGPCVMLFIPHLFKIHTVATIHGLDWQRAKWGRFATWYLKLGEKNAAKYADEIVVLSKNMQKYFWDTYQRKTNYIANGIAKPKLKKSKLIEEKWNLHKDEYILFLGRIVPEKGLEYLINAFKNIKTEKRLIIAGGASDTNDFYAQMQELAKDDERIEFIGFVQGRTLEELYSNSYLYVLPSDLEGMPISLLEAMSYGNACLVSDIPECSEVVEDHAVIFEKSNVKDLEDKLQMCCDQTELIAQYKEKASKYICEKYNWDDVVNRTMTLYRKNRRG